MVHLVWLIGALIVAWGFSAVLQPQFMKKFIQFLNRGRRYFLAAAIRLTAAVIFLVFAKQTNIPRITLLFGLLSLAGGILVLVLPRERIKRMLNWWANKRLWVFRIWGVAAILVGAIIIYAGWPAV